MSERLRQIPSIELIMQSDVFREIVRKHSRPLVVRALQEEIELLRARIISGECQGDVGRIEAFSDLVRTRLRDSTKPSLHKVLNGTGVILHTNLGRAILSQDAVEAMASISCSYSNLEYDVNKGVRGSRYGHCSRLLKELTGGKSALVLNNGAAALVMALRSMASGREVLVSRGELVEIGGGFRIPEILECSGARLTEVGSTNRTRIEDYRKVAENGDPGLILKVHRSNFNITGFTEEASLSSLIDLGKEMEVPVVHDLGSGLLLDHALLGLPYEPTPKESLDLGADIVIFSGDKLLGGPQAGILVGRGEDLIESMQKDPLCRALRVDKTTLASLEATLLLHRDPELAMVKIPILRMLTASLDRLTERAVLLNEALTDALVNVKTQDCFSVMGGGTFPDFEMPSIGLVLDLPGYTPNGLSEKLRNLPVPLVGRIENDNFLIDLRTILEEQDQQIIECLSNCFT
tara:strand:+ start:366 stop:1754 length:1389 start_codon:yes stop_codon:yes gene_type:complete